MAKRVLGPADPYGERKRCLLHGDAGCKAEP